MRLLIVSAGRLPKGVFGSGNLLRHAWPRSRRAKMTRTLYAGLQREGGFESLANAALRTARGLTRRFFSRSRDFTPFARTAESMPAREIQGNQYSFVVLVAVPPAGRRFVFRRSVLPGGPAKVWMRSFRDRL